MHFAVTSEAIVVLNLHFALRMVAKAVEEELRVNKDHQ